MSAPLTEQIPKISKAAPKKKKAGKTIFRKINDWLHLWLGIASGIVIIIVGLTGCIYAFEQEIRNFTAPYQFVEKSTAAYLPPSQLKVIAEKKLFGDTAGIGENHVAGVAYNGEGKAASAGHYTEAGGYHEVFMNPYTGQVLKVKNYNSDFFRIILDGHYYLWLPPVVGQPIVAWSILVFLLLLITGIVMWWPKNLKKANTGKSFKIKWGASFKRVNYDLHNVLGFYVLLIAFALTVTGLVWGFDWFRKSYYFTLNGGKTLAEYKQPLSDSTGVNRYHYTNGEDKIWQQLQQEYAGKTMTMDVEFAEKEKDPVSVYCNPGNGTYYKGFTRYFDRYSLKEIKSDDLYSKQFAALSTGEKIYRMNYDIHVGAVLGIPGKILAFFASFICASLPVTGFIIWWGKKKKKKQPKDKKPSLSVN